MMENNSTPRLHSLPVLVTFNPSISGGEAKSFGVFPKFCSKVITPA
jgi:hypothetical protein